MTTLNRTVRIVYPFPTSFLDYADTENLAVLVYFMGCDNNCDECHNVQFKDFNYKQNTLEMNLTDLIDKLNLSCMKNYTTKVVLTGGDPLANKNLSFTKALLGDTCNNFDFMIYTGTDVEWSKSKEIVGFEFLKCGKYISLKSQKSEKTDEYIKFASTNQKLYDKNYRCISIDGIYHFNRE